MSAASDSRSAEFLKIADQFKLGCLVTEDSHPVTASLSDVAQRDIAAALKLLFEVDGDVLRKYREFAAGGRAEAIAATVYGALERGGRVFFTGCGSTGRLSIQLASIWRDFWQQTGQGNAVAPGAGGDSFSADMENRAFAVMAGGDYALIKAVEGFEDFSAFGRRQIADLGVRSGDVVFAITEGGETSFVIGTAWQGVEVGAKVYFVYNNPDDILCRQVQRSREVIEDPRIEKINLTTGPMAITGSTRMQATTIQLCVLVTVLESVVRKLWADRTTGSAATPLLRHPTSAAEPVCNSEQVPARFLEAVRKLHDQLQSPGFLRKLAAMVSLEQGVYGTGHKLNYFADSFGIDVLTDTTERSPTYCTPPFRKFDDATATESWAFLFIPQPNGDQAWQHVIKRRPRCIDWQADEVRGLVPGDKLARTVEILSKISYPELMRFRIGLDGLTNRSAAPGNSVVAILGEAELDTLLEADGFVRQQLESAHRSGATIGLIFVGSSAACTKVEQFVAGWASECVFVGLAVPATGFWLDGVTRVGLKMVLNALSTCTMVRLGRVMGNTMIWVVPSNLKLIDRATRYVQELANLDYAVANRLLFEVIEYIEPRVNTDQAYPPAVGLSVLRARYDLTNEEAERRLSSAGSLAVSAP
jgi:N-acetylmuramic acid 6-phosphate etherase